MAYVDYSFYKDIFHGQMTEDVFVRTLVPAEAYIDAITFGRAIKHSETEQIKKACCAVADACRLNETGGGVVSETVGKISRNYAAGISNTPTEEQRLKRAASLYLAGTGLMYRGW